MLNVLNRPGDIRETQEIIAKILRCLDIGLWEIKVMFSIFLAP